MDAGQFATLLANIRSADNAARSAAEKAYTELLANNANQAFALLAGCLPAGSGADEVLRTQACTMLRRATVQVGSTQVPWSRADSAVQSQVKIALLQALESEPSASIRKFRWQQSQLLPCTCPKMQLLDPGPRSYPVHLHWRPVQTCSTRRQP